MWLDLIPPSFTNEAITSSGGHTNMQSNTAAFSNGVRKKSIVSLTECATTKQRVRCPMQSALHPSEEGHLLKDLKWEANWKSRMISLKSTCTFLPAALPVIWTHFLTQKGSPFQSCQQLHVPRWKLKIVTWSCSTAPHGLAVSRPKSLLLFPSKRSFLWDWESIQPLSLSPDQGF